MSKQIGNDISHAWVKVDVANCTTTNLSAVVTTTGNFTTAGVKANQKVAGNGIPAETYVVSVDNDTQITLSKDATADGTVTLTFSDEQNTEATPVDVAVPASWPFTKYFKHLITCHNPSTESDVTLKLRSLVKSLAGADRHTLVKSLTIPKNDVTSFIVEGLFNDGQSIRLEASNDTAITEDGFSMTTRIEGI